jgi:FMN phosphatase YigB (HAD superfamily)
LPGFKAGSFETTRALVKGLEAPVNVVMTAERVGVYKAWLHAFHYMLDKLGTATLVELASGYGPLAHLTEVA